MPSTGATSPGLGVPPGSGQRPISRLSEAEAAVRDCAAAVAEVDERVGRHAVLTQQVAELSQLRLAAGPRLAAARAAADKIAELTRQAREAKLVAAAAAATNAAAAAAHNGRLRLLTEIETRAATIAEARPKPRKPSRLVRPRLPKLRPPTPRSRRASGP